MTGYTYHRQPHLQIWFRQAVSSRRGPSRLHGRDSGHLILQFLPEKLVICVARTFPNTWGRHINICHVLVPHGVFHAHLFLGKRWVGIRGTHWVGSRWRCHECGLLCISPSLRDRNGDEERLAKGWCCQGRKGWRRVVYWRLSATTNAGGLLSLTNYNILLLVSGWHGCIASLGNLYSIFWGQSRTHQGTS